MSLTTLVFAMRRRVAPVVACWLVVAASVRADQAAMPKFGAVVAAIQAHFASSEVYRDGDLISRAQIEAALRSVEDAGWKVPHGERVAAMGLADDSFLVRELATPAGQRFMRKIAGQPGTYSRLDRLTSIARGQSLVRDLIRKPGGDELVTYLATTGGGHNLGRSMAGLRDGVDLNKPTGRIYTADDLIAVLNIVYERTLP
jgi:hypothetical protein